MKRGDRAIGAVGQRRYRHDRNDFDLLHAFDHVFERLRGCAPADRGRRC